MPDEKSPRSAGEPSALDVFADKLRELRTRHGLGQRRFAEWLGLPATTYHEYEKKKRRPLLEAVVQVLRRTGVSADWLLLGRGPMFPRESVHSLLAELRRDAGLAPEQVAEALGVTAARYRAFEQGDALPDLAAHFEPLARALGCDPPARQRLFDALEREARPLYFRDLMEAEEKERSAGAPRPRTARFGKFLEPWQLRRLLDRDEEAFRLYQAQPLARKAALVMAVLRHGIQDPDTLRALIRDNFSDIRILEQVRTLLASDHRQELVSFLRFLLHKPPADDGGNSGSPCNPPAQGGQSGKGPFESDP